MVWAYLMALSATDAFVVVDVRLTLLVIVYRILGAVCVTWPCNASAAEVRHLVVYLYAG